MSTRSSVFYEDDGVHVYQELIELPDTVFYLEYCRGPFEINLRLPDELRDIILRGLERGKP